MRVRASRVETARRRRRRLQDDSNANANSKTDVAIKLCVGGATECVREALLADPLVRARVAVLRTTRLEGKCGLGSGSPLSKTKVNRWEDIPQCL